MLPPINRALISVSDKTGIEELAKFLNQKKIQIISTGGTAKKLRDAGVEVVDISDYTGFPEIMDGRVKTLHPKVHGGLLARLDDKEHVKAMEDNDISSIGLVIVNLYPFEDVVAKGADYEEAVENIDIGGPSMVRSAAKNHGFTTIITDPTDYEALQEELESNNGSTSVEFRKKMAAKAFARTALYDAAIGAWFAREQDDSFPDTITLCAKKKQSLRYGENPHQNASFYVLNKAGGVAAANQTQGKELSYNNINDADAALSLLNEFEKPTAVIVKHANPCGVGFEENISLAYEKALSSDPLSAFGGIMAFNRNIDISLAEKLSSIFVEAIIAPDIEKDAAKILSKKKNLRILLNKNMTTEKHGHDLVVKSVVGGFLVQDVDNAKISRDDLKTVTKRAPTEEEIDNMLFAFSVCKHVKSNAIVLVKDKATIGIGAGQMSRVDSVRIASIKAADCKKNPERANGSVLASDAFFPFADGLIEAAKAGVKAVIQPGGSMRDEEVIKAADENDIAMVFTGKRNFRH